MILAYGLYCVFAYFDPQGHAWLQAFASVATVISFQPAVEVEHLFCAMLDLEIRGSYKQAITVLTMKKQPGQLYYRGL